MKHNKNNAALITAGVILLIILAICSLLVGKYPLTISGVLSGDAQQVRVFKTLRLYRALTGAAGGFVLGVAGYVFQSVFHNALAAPDMIGVSSGASAGAAFGILYFGQAFSVTVCAFSGALMAVLLTLLFAAADRSHQNGTIVLCGIAVHAMAQTVLMILKMVADPEKELASIEYWIMGSLSGISAHRARWNLLLALLCAAALFFLFRQLTLLSSQEGEARMLGVNVGCVRMVVIVLATLATACIISLTGLISFVSLLAPHAARLIIKGHKKETMLMAGLMGGCLLCAADLLARSVSASELPVSIFTSMLGAPFLVYLVLAGRRTS